MKNNTEALRCKKKKIAAAVTICGSQMDVSASASPSVATVEPGAVLSALLPPAAARRHVKTHLSSASSAPSSGDCSRCGGRLGGPPEACSWAARLAAMARGYLARGRGAPPLCRAEGLHWRWQADSPTHSPACFSPKVYGPKRAKCGFRLKASLSRYPLCHCYACTYGLVRSQLYSRS